MKKTALSCALLSLFATHAYAQSSVTLFGTMDAGISYVSNMHGSSAALMTNGNSTPNFWGVRGSEDLGGGNHAIFLLLDQYNLGTGAFTSGAGTIFSRNAYVGLSNDRYGTVTMGDQYDFMSDSLNFQGMEAGPLYGGFFNFRQGPFAALAIPGNVTGSADFDRVAGFTRVTNSVKFTSVDYNGFTFGALYGFGGTPGDFSASDAVSFGANYNRGALGLGAAYIEQKYASMDNGHAGIRNWGAGAHYLFGQLYTNLLYTNTRNTLSGAEINVVEVGGQYRFNPVWDLGVDYQYMKGNAELTNNKAHQVTASLRYHLSKKTLVYVEGVYQRASGDSATATAWINGLYAPNSASGGPTQVLATLGMQTRF
jgi:predicted porin